MKRMTKWMAGCASFALAAAAAGLVMARDGQPSDWQLNFQEPATPVMHGIRGFHDFLLIIITAITLFVLALLIYVMWRYNEKSNPVPSKTSHNTAVEVMWTVVPVIILVVIAVPSFRLLYAQYNFPPADLTIKTTGHTWYWSYEYPDQGLSFDANVLKDGLPSETDMTDGKPRLLATDNDVVVPVNKNVHLLVTASNVMHNWAMPAFGVKQDAVPGRVTRTWFRAERTGVFYGQCSELCGDRHAYMPITVRVVTDEEYAAWLVKAKQEFASQGIPSTKTNVAKTPAQETIASAQ
jgi:cytochrome c oxidase subunit 2